MILSRSFSMLLNVTFFILAVSLQVTLGQYNGFSTSYPGNCHWLHNSSQKPTFYGQNNNYITPYSNNLQQTWYYPRWNNYNQCYQNFQNTPSRLMASQYNWNIGDSVYNPWLNYYHNYNTWDDYHQWYYPNYCWNYNNNQWNLYQNQLNQQSYYPNYCWNYNNNQWNLYQNQLNQQWYYPNYCWNYNNNQWNFYQNQLNQNSMLYNYFIQNFNSLYNNVLSDYYNYYNYYLDHPALSNDNSEIETNLVTSLVID